MLGFFTDPYPDELLYSAAARYHYRSKYKKTAFTTRDLFNNDAYKIPVDLPSHIDNLIDRLPPGHSYTAGELIEKHTLYPFYAPFLPKERARTIRDYMRSSSKGGSIYALVGLLSFKIYLSGLRFCPACAAKDREIYGETYWHRPHQLPGVFVCAKHSLFLNRIEPHPRQIEDRNGYLVNAEQVIKLSEIHPVNLSNSKHLTYYKIAGDAEWLSNNTIKNEDAYSFNARYRYILFNTRLSTIGGSVLLSKVKKKFSETYSPDFLNEISCELSESESTWIDRLFKSVKTCQHPVRHFLFIQYCGYSLKEFLQFPVEIQPFGKKPFPCLNPVADHFREPIVEKVVIASKQKSDTEVSGTFYCSCGFVYRKFWHNGKRMRKFEFDRIVHFGEVWDNALRRMFENSIDPNFEDIGKQLGVVSRTLTRQIARLCLTDKYDSLKPKRLGNARMSFEEIEQKRELYRKKWLAKRCENPNFSRTELRNSIEPIFSWLYKHDPEWLKQNLPVRKKYEFTKQYVDWNKRDKEASCKIEVLAAELKGLPGRPVYVSMTALYRKLKINNLVKNPHLVPLTMKALNTFSENYEEYAFRRIEWGVRECFEKEKCLGRYAFMEMTGIAPRFLLNHPMVNEKLNEALRKMEAII